ncbi:hypothetical protein BT96DRAFT_999826 [Gymnopus androsaceus JB14]|uniref:Uncharacterized protein n=1 Tax=Gymnopus androsaceus JB14 TaxID=1447944 RepID=A0A6A4H764_9AGAR|nr:hypothetical protein BT96DRAFT_999826 [Gymnopus androsaceus JB14]
MSETRVQIWNVVIPPNTTKSVRDLLPHETNLGNWFGLELKRLALPHSVDQSLIHRTTVSVFKELGGHTSPSSRQPLTLGTLVPVMHKDKELVLRMELKDNWFIKVQGHNPINISGLLHAISQPSPSVAKGLTINVEPSPHNLPNLTQVPPLTQGKFVYLIVRNSYSSTYTADAKSGTPTSVSPPSGPSRDPRLGVKPAISSTVVRSPKSSETFSSEAQLPSPPITPARSWSDEDSNSLRKQSRTPRSEYHSDPYKHAQSSRSNRPLVPQSVAFEGAFPYRLRRKHTWY